MHFLDEDISDRKAFLEREDCTWSEMLELRWVTGEIAVIRCVTGSFMRVLSSRLPEPWMSDWSSILYQPMSCPLFPASMKAALCSGAVGRMPRVRITRDRIVTVFPSPGSSAKIPPRMSSRSFFSLQLMVPLSFTGCSFQKWRGVN